jgi:hypothetical protein
MMGLDPNTPPERKFPQYPTLADGARKPPRPGLAWFNLDRGSAPIYVVPANQPRVKCANWYTINGKGWPQINDLHNILMEGVPIPPDAKVDPSSDRSLVIYQPPRIWEFWKAQHKPGTYKGEHGGTAGDYEWLIFGGGLMDKPGDHLGMYHERPPRERRLWGHTAISCPIYAGVITPEEWAAGEINHALNFVVGNAQKGHVAPARRNDGTLTNPDAIMEGCRVRFPASFTWDHLSGNPFHKGIKALGEAIQKYGLFVTDKTLGGCAPRFRSPITYSRSPYTFTDSAGKKKWPNEYMWSLPWHLAQVVDPSISPDLD